MQFFVQESLFYHLLTVVKDTIHFQGDNIFSEGGHLFFLKRAHFTLWKKQADPYPRYIIKSVCNGTPGIPGCGCEDRDLLSLMLRNFGIETSHESGPKILESESWPMKQLQYVLLLAQIGRAHV